MLTHFGRVSKEGLFQAAASLERPLQVCAPWWAREGERAGPLVETGRFSEWPLLWTPFLGGEGLAGGSGSVLPSVSAVAMAHPQGFPAMRVCSGSGVFHLWPGWFRTGGAR